jgi:predicted patatin/cPLA2 family phospholipase
VLSLVIGGGAMRGAVAGGMLAVLEDAGANGVFDHVYGASAGATTGAIFLAHQCRQLLPLFLKRLASRKFIRMTSHGLYTDIPYVYQKLLKEEAPLQINHIRRQRTVLHIAVTDVDTGKCHWFTNHDTVDMLTALQASAAIPAFYNIPVTIDGARYLDGGIAEPFSVSKAIADGATHLLVLSTVPEDYRAVNRHPLVERWALGKTKKFGTALRRAYKARYGALNHNLDLAFGRATVPHGVSLLTIAPHTLIGWAERKQKLLQRAVGEGMEEMKKVLR